MLYNSKDMIDIISKCLVFAVVTAALAHDEIAHDSNNRDDNDKKW